MRALIVFTSVVTSSLFLLFVGVVGQLVLESTAQAELQPLYPAAAPSWAFPAPQSRIRNLASRC